MESHPSPNHGCRTVTRLAVKQKLVSQNEMNTWSHMQRHRYSQAWQRAIRSASCSSPTVPEQWTQTICQAEQKLQLTLSGMADIYATTTPMQ